MRRFLAVMLPVVSCCLGSVAAFQPVLDSRAIDEAIRIGFSRLPAERLALHPPYRIGVGQPPVEQPGVQVTGGDVGVGEQEAKELHVGGQPEDRGVGERGIERAQCGRPVGGVRAVAVVDAERPKDAARGPQ